MDEAPVCVAVHAVAERMLGEQQLDELFRNHCRHQYESKLLFSTLVQLISQVIVGARRSVHEAYRHARQDIAVSITAVYGKLNGLEPAIAQAVVRHSAAEVLAVAEHLSLPPPPLPGFETRIVDGNHLAATEHRLEELRHTRSGPLPGQCLVVLDPRRKLIDDVIPCENGHAQERSLVGELLGRVRACQLWIADRNFCTTKMLCGVVARGAYFLVRQHGSTLTWEPAGPWRACGRCASGTLREQPIRVLNPDGPPGPDGAGAGPAGPGQWMTVRRIELTLDTPTRDGDEQVFLLTNLPPEAASPAKVADLYHQRWQVEGAFEELTTALRCEVKTLGYPRAALLAFCVALTAYNAVSLVRLALSAVHGPEQVETDVSFHQLAREVAATGPGMRVAVPPRAWKVFVSMSVPAFGQTLIDLARRMDLRRYRKHPRGPKKKRPPRSHGRRHKHVATAKLLAQRRTADSS